MSIRRLIPTDAERYRALMLEAYAAHPDAFTSSVSERTALPLAWWETRLAERDDVRDRVWGAFEADQLVGVAGLSLDGREKVSHRATLFGMYVQPSYRGCGLGDGLVEAVLQYVRSHSELRVAQLTVTDGNRSARSLYERHGFVVFGIEPYAVRMAEGFVTKVHMWRHIEPIDPTQFATPLSEQGLRSA